MKANIISGVVCLILLGLMGCSGLKTIEPVAYQVSTSSLSADLEVAAKLTNPEQPVLYGYPVYEPAAVVVLVHGLGTNAAIWDLPHTAKLARRIWRAGYSVYTIDLNFSSAQDSLAQTRKGLRQAIKAIARRHRGKKILGIGHDIGGTLLYQMIYQEKEATLDGLIAMGAPIGFGGYSKAVKKLLLAGQKVPAVTWPMLDRQDLKQPGGFDIRVSELLLSSSLPEKTRFAFYENALSKMPASLLNEIQTLGKGQPVPVLDPLMAKLSLKNRVPILALMAPSDGLSPPWQCDPKVFGFDQNGIETVYLTRANGESIEYNHLDMLLHPLASREVFPLVMTWLADRID
ncbi:MAG: alpha/beta fold hydrolase [Deltaproteobacteria bacterium]|nr:alpha/beta fold hydrolase [Deltaproteobacteria bacterium]